MKPAGTTQVACSSGCGLKDDRTIKHTDCGTGNGCLKTSGSTQVACYGSNCLKDGQTVKHTDCPTSGCLKTTGSTQIAGCNGGCLKDGETVKHTDCSTSAGCLKTSGSTQVIHVAQAVHVECDGSACFTTSGTARVAANTAHAAGAVIHSAVLTRTVQIDDCLGA